MIGERELCRTEILLKGEVTGVNRRFISGKEWMILKGMIPVEVAMCSCFAGIAAYDLRTGNMTPGPSEYLWEWTKIEILSYRMTGKLNSISGDISKAFDQIFSSDVIDIIEIEKTDYTYCNELSASMYVYVFNRLEVCSFENNGGFDALIKNVIDSKRFGLFFLNQLKNWKSKLERENKLLSNNSVKSYNDEVFFDNPLDYGKWLMDRYPNRTERIIKLEKMFPELTTDLVGAYARGLLPSESSKAANKKWYQDNKPR